MDIMKENIKEKITTFRLMPSKTTNYVRVSLTLSIIVLLYSPLKSNLISEGVTLRHSDVESGIMCVLEKNQNFSITCSKSEYIGLGMREIALNKKIWKYDLPNNDVVTISREGYSTGLKITAESTLFSGKLEQRIPYKNSIESSE